ncbi:protein farnesyltransferase subunit beta-like isoform X2 [Alosa sapidissima]|uniref:protein farnesyltransferase subunit beta-like isoform X2 n=1 Tax=Alosa sapidissima TaxID=34773 RepID=UPI001C0920AA|nr:protein farnesyltransferase subunit beta-like isoform X2 [Alosa sapidissima]
MKDQHPPLRCFQDCHNRELFQDDGLQTVTSSDQKRVEESICEVIHAHLKDHRMPRPILLREQHIIYLTDGLQHLSESYETLDASRPWLCFWLLHSLDLLLQPVAPDLASDVCKFISKCQSPTGGFAGGPGQQAHLAPTYAAVNALCVIGTQEAYDVIDREKLLDFLYSLRQKDGSFQMHAGGEVDVRSIYCAASVASLTNIITPDLFEGTCDWVARCQSWEGGMGGVPGLEAHGGYTFCALAALVILEGQQRLNIRALLRWACSRQMRFEGGFQGRCNKLVDGCYSFWQGGILHLIHQILLQAGDPAVGVEGWMFEQRALQEYLLFCCQCPDGGLLDKPGKLRDFYHTSYCLSGLSMAQHSSGASPPREHIQGGEENRLARTHPVYNVNPEKVARALAHFNTLPLHERRHSPHRQGPDL